VDALEALGHHSEADDIESYLVEVLVLTGRFDEACGRGKALLERLADRRSEVVVLTTRRLAAVAAHFTGDPSARAEVARVLQAARDAECGIEISRGLQALQACSSEVDPRWAREQAEWCEALGVTWMPPVMFATA
jgi:hypothetical protein